MAAEKEVISYLHAFSNEINCEEEFPAGTQIKAEWKPPRLKAATARESLKNTEQQGEV